MQQKEKTMSNFRHNITVKYIKDNNKEEIAFTFDSHSEFDKFFDYILKLRHDKNSNIYNVDFSTGYKADTATDAVNELIGLGEVLLPGADAFIAPMDMEFEEA